MKYDGDSVKEWAGRSQWRAWRADPARFRSHGYSGWASEGFWALTIYRLQRGVRGLPCQSVWMPLRVLLAILRKCLVTMTHISLQPDSETGPGLRIPHVGPIQVFPPAWIGGDCAIRQVFMIGAGSCPGGPRIGDHLTLGCHTCALGSVSGGDGARIGTGAVVVVDTPAWSVAVGVPARAAKSSLEAERGS